MCDSIQFAIYVSFDEYKSQQQPAIWISTSEQPVDGRNDDNRRPRITVGHGHSDIEMVKTVQRLIDEKFKSNQLIHSHSSTQHHDLCWPFFLLQPFHRSSAVRLQRCCMHLMADKGRYELKRRTIRTRATLQMNFLFSN